MENVRRAVLMSLITPEAPLRVFLRNREMTISCAAPTSNSTLKSLVGEKRECYLQSETGTRFKYDFSPKRAAYVADYDRRARPLAATQ